LSSRSFQSYLTLTKPKIILLLDFTAVAAFLVAVGSRIDLARLVSVLLAGTLASGGAGALNSYIDREIDRKMGRTSRRPIPMGEVSPEQALIFGVGLVTAALVVSLALLPLLATFFIMLGAGIYVLFYTAYLKPRTTLNIVLGGSAGSCAPLAGWAAATGQASLAAWLMALLVFVWTPSHFWGLAMRAVGDYSKAGIPMLPVVVGEKKAAQYIALNTFLLVPLSLVFVPLGMFGLAYLTIAGVLGLGLIFVDVKLAFNPTKSQAWTAFKFSSPYLAIVFLAMVLDSMLLAS
jgi:protoheme IX farnesyltransferase